MANKGRIFPKSCMSSSESLAPRTRASLDTIQDFLGTLVARYRSDEVLTAVRQFPARAAKFRPMPAWVTSVLVEAYRFKRIETVFTPGIEAELVRAGKNVVVVTPTASGKTLCYHELAPTSQFCQMSIYRRARSGMRQKCRANSLSTLCVGWAHSFQHTP